MNTKTSHQKDCSLFVLCAASLLFTISFSTNSRAQGKWAVDGEIAICKITVNNKVYVLPPNQIGNFTRVYNIQPLSTIAVEVLYPKSTPGEMVIISAEDGGMLDNNKKVKVTQLDNQKKVTFNFQTFYEPGINKLTIQKGKDTKFIQLAINSDISTQAINSNISTQQAQTCGVNNGQLGNSPPPPDCNGAGSNPFDPYTDNGYREVKDLEVWGAVGQIPLVWMRYGISRNSNFKSSYGNSLHWNSSFQYFMFDDGNNQQGQPQVTIHFPEGEENIFTQDSSNPNLWLPPAGIGKRLFQNGNIFLLQTEEGFHYRFDKLTDTSGGTYYQLQSIRDSYQNVDTLEYNSNKLLTRVVESAGRYLEITYGSINGKTVITRVSTSDGRSVQYNYDVFNDGIATWDRLISVNYGDGTQALYTYSQTEPGVHPVLQHAVDPRYTGHAVDMMYTYDTTVLGFIKEERNGKTGEAMATLSSVTGSRKVCYPNGRLQTYTVPVNDLGQVSAYTDGLGATTTYNRANGGTGFLLSEKDALGRITMFNRRTIYGNLLKITYPDGSIERWGRDNLDLIIRDTDALSRITIFTRDANHRVSRINYPDNTFETFTYNNFGEVLNHQRRNGGNEHSVYDIRGLLTSFTDALGNVTTYTYDGADHVASVKDARGNTTKYEYNERGLVTKIINQGNSFKSYGYDAFGNRTTVSDELVHVWTTVYDEFRRHVSVTDPLGRVTRYLYDLPGGICGCTHDNNKPTSIVLPSGKSTGIGYDVEWQKISETIGAGTKDSATTFYEYDLEGNLVTMVDPKQHNWVYEYDSRNRRISASDPLGHTTKQNYDNVGNILKTTRPDDGTITSVYDKMNRLLQTTNPNGEVTKMAYDHEGNMIQLTDAKNNIYTFQYDLLNRRTKTIYPDNSFEVYTYDPVSNIKTYTNRAGKIRTYTYDARNRETTSNWNDNLTPAINRSYDAASRLLTMSSTASSLTYTYDKANELTGETQKINGISNSKTVGYTYNADGLHQTMGYPSGNTLSYKYTGRNQLLSVSASGAQVVTYTYDLNGNRIKKVFENGTQTLDSLDDVNRILNVDNRKGTISFARFDYGYDNINRRTFMQRDNSKGDVYSYDAIDQVTKVLYDATNPGTNPQNPAITESFDWDPVGNRNKLTINATSTLYTTNILNEYIKVDTNSLKYDQTGNLTNYDGWTYQYDAQNRLITASKGTTTVAFAYDATNRCVKRTINGTVTFFYYNDWNLIEERNSTDVLKETHINGAQVDEILKKIAPALPTVYYHYDALGSVVSLTNQTGTVVEKYNYNVFGLPTIKNGSGTIITASAFGNAFMFTGREYIQELKLYAYRNRMYSPALGRFLQTDPMGVGVDYDLYRYVDNNPVNMIDPLGTCSEATHAIVQGVCYEAPPAISLGPAYKAPQAIGLGPAYKAPQAIVLGPAYKAPQAIVLGPAYKAPQAIVLGPAYKAPQAIVLGPAYKAPQAIVLGPAYKAPQAIVLGPAYKAPQTIVLGPAYKAPQAIVLQGCY